MASSGLLVVAIASGLFCGQVAYLIGRCHGFSDGFDLGADFGRVLRGDDDEAQGGGGR